VTVELEFEVEDGDVRIDLCPLLALCVLPTALDGRVDDRELVLTHFLGGESRAVYRYTAALPE
jgi:hypothetical protein